MPGLDLENVGSTEQLEAIIAWLSPIQAGDRAKLKFFNMLFRKYSRKLMEDPPILSNREAVWSYLSVFDEGHFRSTAARCSISSLEGSKGRRSLKD